LSNPRIKSELNLTDERYEEVRATLLDKGLVEKKVGYGGGIRLTSKGEREVAPEGSVVSTVDRETDLYPHVIDALQRDFPSDIVFDTGNLRKRGRWQNPDVTQISIDIYPRLRKRDVIITTFEVKQWGRWDVNAVFEAASHARFAHEVFVLLEWPAANLPFTEGGATQIMRECQRFGVGLATLVPYYKRYRIHTQLEAASRRPADADVEDWLEYSLSRDSDASKRFDEEMKTSTSA
jgi:hypothetical protein